MHLNEANRESEAQHHGHNHVGSQRAHIPTPMKQQQMSPTHSNAPAVPDVIDPDLLAQQNGYSMQQPQQRLPCSLDLLSDAATHIAGQQLPSIMPLMQEREHMQHEMDDKRQRTDSFNSRHHDEAMGKSLGGYHQQPNVNGEGLLGDYNILLDDFGISSHVFPPIDTEVPVTMWARPDAPPHSFGGYPDPQRDGNSNNQFAQHDQQFGRYPSRLSQASEYPDSTTTGASEGRQGPPWKISSQDHRYIQSKLDDFSSVLPKTFELPSRHTLSRFLEGYVNGFNEHVPFLHIPTVQIVNLAPELILAIAAIGAQYRFEGHRGNGLWYASRAVAVEQARRRSSSSVMEILSPPATYRSESAGLSPPSTARNPSIAEMGGVGRNGDGNGIDALYASPISTHVFC